MLFRILVWIVFIIGGGIGGFFLDKGLFSELWDNTYWHIVSFLIGVILLWIVIKISTNTGRTLARYRRVGNIPRMETNKLVKEGVYSCMRHPMHLGLMLFPVSFAFLLGSVSFILMIVPLEILLMVIMIILIEEPEVIKKFGEEYLEYKREVSFFNFKRDCLRLLFKGVEPKE